MAMGTGARIGAGDGQARHSLRLSWLAAKQAQASPDREAWGSVSVGWDDAPNG
jgi:hypothetical protein